MNKHTIQLRVRYEETDQMGVVYYSKYLVWFEVARTEFFRVRGVEYSKLEDEDEIFLPVVEAHCHYKSPLRYDDLVTINTELVDVGYTRIVFEYEVKKGDKLVVTGTTKHVFVNKDGSPIAVPDKVKQVFS